MKLTYHARGYNVIKYAVAHGEAWAGKDARRDRALL